VRAGLASRLIPALPAVAAAAVRKSRTGERIRDEKAFCPN
jgi:hypothetical protein